MLEDITDIQSCFGRGLEEAESMLFSQLPASLTLNDLVLSVTLVGNQDLGHVGTGMLIYLFQPILNVIEGLLLSAVVHQDDTHGSLIVSLGYCPETLLSCCVPNLELDSFLVHIDGLDFEVNSYIPVRLCLQKLSYQWWACGSQGSYLQRT